MMLHSSISVALNWITLPNKPSVRSDVGCGFLVGVCIRRVVPTVWRVIVSFVYVVSFIEGSVALST
jgi:hypothetical protein